MRGLQIVSRNGQLLAIDKETGEEIAGVTDIGVRADPLQGIVGTIEIELRGPDAYFIEQSGVIDADPHFIGMLPPALAAI